jgi:phosphoribosylglycinamide formyltransferase-1
VTVHFVNEEMDAGPVISQEVVLIGPKDTVETLERKIHKIEHRLYPLTLKWLMAGKFTIEGRRVVFPR